MDRNKKIQPIYINDKMLEDPQMDELLKKSVMEEADEIEKELNSDPSLKGVKAPDDMFDKIKARLQRQGLWEDEENVAKSEDTYTKDKNANSMDAEDTASGRKTGKELTEEDIYNLLSKEDQKALKIGRKLDKKRKSRWKKLAAAAVVIVVVFSAGMSGEASRRWILDTWNKFTVVTGLSVRTDYVDDGTKSISDISVLSEEEQSAWNAIKEELSVPIVWFNYLPEGMELSDYEVLKDTNEVRLFYSYEEKIFTAKILIGNKMSSFYLQSDVEPLLREKVSNDQDIDIEIWDTTAKGVESYRANFEFQDCVFVCAGAFEFEEFEKIMKYLYVI